MHNSSTENVRAFVDEEVPELIQARLPKVALDAHALAVQIVKDNPVLQVPSLQGGDIRGTAMDFLIHQFINSLGFPGISAEFAPYYKPTGRFLQITTPRARLTISHVPFSTDFPRYAKYREIARIPNHPYLFPDWEEERLAAIHALNDKKHLLLAYGDQRLEFMHIGAMHCTEMRWLAPPINLLQKAHIVSEMRDDDLEGADTKIPMELKEKFIEHVEHNAAS